MWNGFPERGELQTLQIQLRAYLICRKHDNYLQNEKFSRISKLQYLVMMSNVPNIVTEMWW